ncbi:hydrophobic surface binding protein A family protein [Metarhizium robertsii]|uniref:Antigenic cell wall galactomannoprotein n=2 Tax=Metarhizium robertsii TaxID=568076 RepID=E9F6N6_METRA|nr:antigenic cell wall galactomannoprotein [Metarhizium robertsii ARSEF 23]EFY96652.1 antigenic cell wall galactomannoprotein [Metarhizium robertsii ARSEF 23]EXU98976.1 hydrophobic surface binding protein A family protein [Metarhizium robertsii]
MRLTPILSIMALAATAIADGKAITDAMASIKTKTTDLGATVSNWKGDLLGALPITVKSTQLLKEIKTASKTAEQSAMLTTEEALAVAGATTDLSKAVTASLQIIVDAKPKFDRLIILSPVVLLNLEMLQDATDDFSGKVVSKVPEALQGIAQGLIKPIEDAFAAAIDKYRLF